MSKDIDPRDFRQTLGRFATGITIVTTRVDGVTHGITVNAFMSVSLEPPLVLVSIDRNAKAHETLSGSERYGVSVLAEDQQAYSNHFAGRTVDGLEVPYVQLDGFPVLKGAVATLVCGLEQAVPAGDHTLFVGRVEALEFTDASPLVYFRGQYGVFRPPASDPLLDGTDVTAEPERAGRSG